MTELHTLTFDDVIAFVSNNSDLMARRIEIRQHEDGSYTAEAMDCDETTTLS